jgi:SAM-dependent methyltransferase
MKGNYSGILSQIQKYAAKPDLFEPGEPRFWDDPHISRGMLEAHLNPDHDAASRRPETIDKEVSHLISSGTLTRGDRLIDLGCGPGLYASRLCERGVKVTGVDISERSLNYAIAQSVSSRHNIEYRLMDFFDIKYSGEFDAALQAHGELATFSDEKRDELLATVHDALKPGGIFIFDVTSSATKPQERLPDRWYIADGGFWRPGKHLVLEQAFFYLQDSVHVDQYIVVDEKDAVVYRTWIRHYTLRSIRACLKKAGFKIERSWNDLAGTPYKVGGEWLAIAARRI